MSLKSACGYGAIGFDLDDCEIGMPFQKNEFSFMGYKNHVLMSTLRQALIVRWIISYIIYSMKWEWFQVLLWRIMKPVVILIAWLFVLNWGNG